MMPLRIQLKEARLAKGLTQVRLAELAGVRTATVNRIENHRVTAIDLTVLAKLAKALGVSAGLLLTDNPDTAERAASPARTTAKQRPKQRKT
jgi:transcriptional regulator with XRE-family HTH domain